DVDVRKSLGFLLATADFAVRLHESATAFLSTAKGNLEGCIVTDVRMPGIDGIEFLRQLRAGGHTIRVIVMTGHADVALAVQAMKEGAADFIEKPFDDEMLIEAIRSALANRNQAN
ncbi:response regulator, partial [Mesorhizobium sp. M00.F.Ca.ET.158.01.1.1]